MTVEQQPETLSHPGPSKEETAEMSLGAGLYRLVDDLFTHQAIAEKLQANVDDPALERLAEAWKQSLVQQLSQVAQSSVDNVVGILNQFQTGQSTPVTESERLEWERIAHRYDPFVVSSICREDLRGILPNEEIMNLTDGEMQQLATKMSDVYQDSGDYWETLKTNAHLIVAQKQESDEPTPTQPSTKPQPPTSGQANNTPS